MARYQSQQTHCRNGHPFDEANTHRNSKGHRSCRACHRDREMVRRGPPPPRDYWAWAAARFWPKVFKSESCWLYLPNGRTIRSNITVAGQTMAVSRFSWTIHNGPIPEGLFVCHHCDTPKCVRPDHLFLGTAADNSADMVAKGRSRGAYAPNPPRGVRHPKAKLDDEKVRQMRLLRSEGMEYRPIAAMFGVTPRAAWTAVNRITWTHVE